MFVALLSSLEGAAPAASGGGGAGGFMEAFKENPTFLAINLVVSAIVIALIVERASFQLGKYRVNSKEFFAQIKKLVTAGNIDRAIKLCDAGDYPTLQLVKAGLTHANKGPDEIDAAMSEKMGELKPAVEKRIGSLWSLANIATLVGLLGTVLGLIHTFGAVSAPGLSAADRQRILANGIAEAMYNTALGLGIAVTCMIAHLILHQRSKTIQHDLDATQERVFNLLTIQTRPGGY
ncbi:MotA/TolQ/ExbB proton channel family protein [Labilithrix luteola]|uniref:MotA/TolQ/ExbB proton channel family protein n=1 Tax=Labilithrix luteola TaxID=1391654 RepID=A0A0K1Q1V3_9BACT|nr:MotA/TolQ/ExbB proton channel family protein [Labilithrix luteola]AKU99780.1 MotA/TolQ/ExbB proton channel family protein [Labilithrix luteola]